MSNPVTPLREHPLVKADYPSLEGDEKKLGYQLKSLLHLDANAAYRWNNGTTLVYYRSPHAKPLPDGMCARLAIDDHGQMRHRKPPNENRYILDHVLDPR